MATIDKEQRARRKKLKVIHELNQLLKTVYRSYVIYPNGTIVGNVVLDKDKRPKEKYAHGYFKSEDILIEYPELSNSCIFSSNVYLAFRDDKPEEFYIKDNEIFLKGEKGEYKVGILLDDNMLEKANRKLEEIASEVSVVMESVDASMTLSEDTIEQLIGYEKIVPRFYDNDEYVMHLTISEFPFLKKFKNCHIYMHDTSARFFDVVYSTFTDKNKFVMRRRFLKLKELTE